MEITYKDLISLMNYEHEIFNTINIELEDVDDHGDSSYALVFRNPITNECWGVTYSVEKEWGVIKQDAYDCERVYPHIVQKTVWRSTP